MAASTIFQLALISLISGSVSMKLGAITYWNDVSSYTTLPTNSYAIINPNNGILGASTSDIAKYKGIISQIKSKISNVKLFGYVPTGYGNRTKQPYSRIQDQITAYFGDFSQLDGIFFDETDGKCGQTEKDLPEFRKFVKNAKSNALITYNPGWVGDKWCYLNLAQSGEIVMDFENTFSNYVAASAQSDLNQAKTIAANRGVKTWHVIYGTASQNMQAAINKAKQFGADYVYVAENNSYNKPPSYWEAEKRAVSG